MTFFFKTTTTLKQGSDRLAHLKQQQTGHHQSAELQKAMVASSVPAEKHAAIRRSWKSFFLSFPGTPEPPMVLVGGGEKVPSSSQIFKHDSHV